VEEIAEGGIGKYSKNNNEKGKRNFITNYFKRMDNE
jgi:hypothetical protein